MKKFRLTPARRKRAYKVGKALAGVLAVYGVCTGQEAAAILLLFGALLDVADRNVNDQ